MSGYFPSSGFRWLKNVGNFDVKSIGEKSPIGYILKVDPKYPEELHVLHNDIHYLQKNLQFLMTCCQIIVKKLQTNMG